MDIILFHDSLVLVDLVLGADLDNLNFRRRTLYFCLHSLSEFFHGGLIPCLGLITHDSKSDQSRDTAIDTAGSFIPIVHSFTPYLFTSYFAQSLTT